MTDNSKLPPHNLDAEEAVIGSLLLDDTLIAGLSLQPSDFHYEPNQILFSACRALADRNVSINQITLAQELSEQGKLDNIGGAAHLSSLIANCSTPIDCRYYADIVKRLATYRAMIAAADRIAAIGYAEGPDVTESLNQADEMLLSLRKNGSSPQILTPQEWANKLGERYEQLFKARGCVALPTGLKDLDAQIGGGLYAGELAIVGARPGMGKTTLMMNIADEAGELKNVLFCSAEMPSDSIGDREVASELKLTTNQVRQGGYDADMWARLIGEGLQSILRRKVFPYHEVPMTTASILQAAVNMQLRHGLDLICVDYLGRLGDEFGNSQYERVSYISRKLKDIAMKLNVPLLAAHQLSRGIELREDKRPQLSDLRDSGKIEEDADLVLFLYRESYYRDDAQDVAEILIAKQRQGESHKIVKVFYDRAGQKYRDLIRESI